MKTTLYTHPSSLRHETGHLEGPQRIEALNDLFESAPFTDWPRQSGRAATEEEIGRAHPLHYIQAIENSIPDEGAVYLDGGDTVITPGSWAAAIHAAGAVCQAVDDVMSRATENAFCAMRPPGHHAEPTRAMGFCLFNNIFIGARHAQEQHGVRKIAIIDFDVHHGNGTDAMTRQHHHEKHGEILYISTHQFPLFPMTGDPEDNEEYVQNWTLHEGDGSTEFRALYESKVFPAIDKFKPELIMLSAGFDAHRDDPYAGLTLLEDDFGWVTRQIRQIAALHASERIVSVLEGGYHLEALKNSVSAHLLALAEPA
jgi:acetoin utilization deacetylase AcuC-like enzyme